VERDVATCSFCGTALPETPQTYVESPDVDREVTQLMRACASCASGFPTKFTVR